MLTPRGFWFLAALLFVLIFGASQRREGEMIFALAGFTFLLAEWLLMFCRAQFVAPWLRVVRLIDGRPAGEAAVVACRSAVVEIRVALPGWLELPRVELTDRAPTLGSLSGPSRFRGSLRDGVAVGWKSVFTAPAAGKARFEGIQVGLSDAQGFFFHRSFLRIPVEVAVLPALVDRETTAAGRKRANSLLSQGLHRHRRSGSGSELLDLRDYIPGDPPRTMAWKVTARRDRLVTKVYESEVPVRCTLVLDGSAALKLGEPGRTTFDRLAALTAALARRLTAGRDPISLCVLDETGAQILPASPGRRQLLRIYAHLAAAASKVAVPTECPADEIVPIAYAFCREVHPDLLHPRRNRLGAGFALLPGRVVTWIVYGVLFLIAFFAAFIALPMSGSRGELSFLGLIIVLGGVLLAAAIAARASRRSSPFGRRRMAAMRKQLAAVLAAREGLGPGALGWLPGDDKALSLGLQKFLGEHRVAYPRPLFGADGRYLFADTQKAGRIRRLLTRLVARGRDNEFFVLMIDVLEATQDWPAILGTVKLTLARRHQVALVCPWPDGMPPPNDPSWTTDALGRVDPLSLDVAALHRLLRLLDHQRYHAAFTRIGEDLAKLGVSLLCSTAADVVPKLLDRLERVRGARTRP